MELLAVAVLVVAGALWFFVARRRDGDGALRLAEGSSPGDDDGRFVLRVTAVSPDGKSVRLGASIETEGKALSHEPTLLSVEATLVDDAENLVELPAGIRLNVRQFEGAERSPLGSVTTSTSIGQSVSFEVAAKLRFWILDAPAWQGCVGTPDPKRRALPPRAEGYEITTRLPPPPAVAADGTIGVTMANISMPLWMHGLEGPDDWLLGARQTEEEGVAVAQLDDPFLESGQSTRDARVGSAVFQLADAVWLETSARATMGVPILVSRARFTTREDLKSWEDLDVWRQKLSPQTILVWGVATQALEETGFDLRVRGPKDPREAEVRGPMATLRKDLLRALVARGVAPAEDALVGSPITPLPPEVEGAYAAVCDLLFLLIMGHPNNEAIPQQTSAVQRQVVDLAKELADLAPDSHVACLTWLVSTIYAHESGGLDVGRRQAALAFVRSRVERSDPIHRLAPALLYRLGEPSEAIAACKEALAEPAEGEGYRGASSRVRSAYRKWLQKVLAKASA